MIIKDFFTNLAILTSILFLYSQITHSNPLSHASDRVRKSVLGLLGGLLSIILMIFSIKIDYALIDLRYIPILLLSFYGGAIPAYIAMVIVIAGRLILGGINTSAYAAILISLFTTILSVYISKKPWSKRQKIFWILSCSNLLFSILMLHIIKNGPILLLLIPLYWLFTYVAGYTSFYIIEYLRHSQFLLNQYKSDSTTDSLTGLNNVRKFDEAFNELVKNLDEKNEKLSLLYIDIDYFKKINDTYGHSKGDIILKELGNLLKSSTRSFDIISRNGGEEFTILLLDCPLDRALTISERIRKNVEKFSFLIGAGQMIHITVSIGVACFDETTEDPYSLIENADKALYEAKETGRNKVCAFS